jgi:SNF2 family DNA or RNA helicase
VLTARADLSQDKKRIEVRFDYSPAGLAAIHEVPGSRWSASKRVWTIPLDLTAGRRLREAFGAGLRISPELRRWGRAEIRRRALRKGLSQASDADLGRLPRVLPKLDALLAGRPYQRADIRLQAISNLINANEPGTGKTIEVIGTVAEAGLIDRPALIVAPVRSIENTWATELKRVGYPHPVFAFEDASQRKGAVNWCWMEWKDNQRPFALVVNPDLLRVKPAPKDTPKRDIVAKDPVTGAGYVANQWTENLLDIDWGLVALDEFHKFGLTNARSQFGLAARLLRAERLLLVSGTPMGGKYKRLWSALNWLHPTEYGSWWNWADQWLEQERAWGGHKKVLDSIQPGREEEFQRAHAHHFIRRTKLADLPGCPAKVHRLVQVGMTDQQERQYRQFEREAEIRINGKRLVGHGLLAEWSRLRSFANATCRVKTRPNGRREVIATADSGKLPYLLDALDETGVRKMTPEPGARAIVGTMDKSFAKITASYLRSNGIDADLLTGETKDSRPIIRRFQGGDPKPYVIVMTVQTGGVSLNLEAAGSVHALDESWDPDDMTQFFERGDRGTRTTPLLCFTYRTKDTIQEYIADVAGGKAINNQNAYQFKDAYRSRAGVPRGQR